MVSRNDAIFQPLIEIHLSADLSQVDTPGRNESKVIINFPIITASSGGGLCLPADVCPTARQGLPVRLSETGCREFSSTLVFRSGCITQRCRPQPGTPAGHATEPGGGRIKGSRASEHGCRGDPLTEQRRQSERVGPAAGIPGYGKSFDPQCVGYFGDIPGCVGDGTPEPARGSGEAGSCYRDQT